MKILVIGHTYIAPINRGKWTAMKEQFPEANIRVVVPQRWPTPFGLIQSKSDSKERLFALPVRKEGNEGGYSFRSGLTKLIREFDPDIVHVEQGSDSLVYAQIISILLATRSKAKVGFFTWMNLESKRSIKVKLLEKFNFRNSDYAICGNTDSVQLMKQRGYKGPTFLCPQLGVGMDIVDSQASGRRVAIDMQSPVIGFVGRLVDQKGISDLYNAWVSLRKKDVFASLAFIGEGDLKTSFMKQAAESPYRNDFRILGPFMHEETIRHMSALDILVLPSRTTPEWKEQFGHVLTEAMACGICIIGSSSGAIPEVIGDAGVIFEEGMLSDLESKLTELIKNPSERKRLAAKGKERLLENYTDPMIAQRTFEVFKKILN